jgi:hypothetical protein
MVAQIFARIGGLGAGLGAALYASSFVTQRAADGHERSLQLLAESQRCMAAEHALVDGRLRQLELTVGIAKPPPPPPTENVSAVDGDADAPVVEPTETTS